MSQDQFIKSEDLNHHGTLFTGRTAEWFVEAGFIAEASLVNPAGIMCRKIHGMHFTKPARSGQILKFVSKVVYTGRRSMISYIEVVSNNDISAFVSGFITFIYIDEKTNPVSHNIEISPKTEEDIELFEKAKNLKKQRINYQKG